MSERSPEWVNEARALHGLPPLEAPPPPPPDASDPAQIKSAQREARIQTRELGNTLHEMMRLKPVRAYFYLLLDRMGAFRGSDFPMGFPLDPLALAANAEGRRQAQLLTADLLGAAPDEYLLMLKEAQDV
jgi:hypothetical protein